jgi:hypothetical protein
MRRLRGPLRHPAVVFLRVLSFAEMFAQAVVEPMTLSRSSRSRSPWSVDCALADILQAAISVRRKLSDGVGRRSFGAMAKRKQS